GACRKLRAMGEIGDAQHSEDDRNAKAQHGVEGAVDDANDQLTHDDWQGVPKYIQWHDLDPKISADDIGVRPGRFARYFIHHLAALDDVVPVGDFRCKAEILFDEDDREAAVLQMPDRRADLLDDNGSQSL